MPLYNPTPQAKVYLFPTFINNEDLLRIAYSIDGIHWGTISDTPLYNPGGSDGVRDPNIWYRGGYYYVSFTAGDFGFCDYWMIARSTDLVNWTTYATISMDEITGANQVWSPVFFHDPASGLDYMFTSVSTDQVSAGGAYTTSKIYAQTPVTPGDFSAWGTPVEVTGTSLPAKVICVRVVKVGANYRLFAKNDVTAGNFIWTSTSLLSGYTVGSEVSWGAAYEGVGLAHLGGSSWRAFMDKYPGFGMYYSDSTDDFATWSAPAAVTSPEVYSNSDCWLTNDTETITRLLAATAAGRLVNASKPRFVGLNINVANDPFLPVHLAPPYGSDGGTFLDSPLGVQNNIALGRGGTKVADWVIDGDMELKILNRPLLAYMTRWAASDGTLRQLLGNITIEQIGKTLSIKTGSNAKAGTFTLSSGTVAVSNTSITANSVVVCSLKTSSGTPGATPRIDLNSGVGFTATGGGSDNSTYNYVVLEVLA